jgi:hypothetical protein
MMAPEILNSALALARAGFQVFPLVYATKVPPKGTRGHLDATANAATIRRLFGGTLKRNIGVRTGAASGIWVLDEDADGAIAALEAQHGPLPITRMVRTASGRHLWWKHPGKPIPNSTKLVGPGLDVRGDGGFVVAPPSLHPNGVFYEWLNDAPIVEAPAWLAERAIMRPALSISEQALAHRRRPDEAGGPSSYGRAALEREITLLAGAGEGARNSQLNRSTFNLHQLVGGGALDAAEVERRLVEACIANGLAVDAKSGGMSQVMRTIRSGARAGLQHPRTAKGRAR